MPLNVVFIDDEQDLCDIYLELFSSDQVFIHAFNNPHEGLDFINNNDVDLCFIDNRMPLLGGVELRKLIQKQVICVLLTGEVQFHPEASFDAVIEKPINRADFEAILNDYYGNDN